MLTYEYLTREPGVKTWLDHAIEAVEDRWNAEDAGEAGPSISDILSRISHVAKMTGEDEDEVKRLVYRLARVSYNESL